MARKPRPTANLPTPDRDEWRTPPELFHLLYERYRFRYDMAATKETRLCDDYCDDSLHMDWPLGGWCWCNPPFSFLTLFADHIIAQASRGVKTCLLLPANRTDQPLWTRIHRAAGRLIWIQPRVAFLPPHDKVRVSQPPFGCVVAEFGEQSDDDMCLNWRTGEWTRRGQ